MGIRFLRDIDPVDICKHNQKFSQIQGMKNLRLTVKRIEKGQILSQYHNHVEHDQLRRSIDARLVAANVRVSEQLTPAVLIAVLLKDIC
jgi:uncharacterized cupin superfamily protein